MALKEQIGSFCWWSLMTKDVDKANDFYQKLFDWTLGKLEMPGGEDSIIYTLGRGGFGNPVPLEKDFPHPSHWIPYIAVASVDDTCKRAEALGGQVCVPAFDIPTVGRTAVITDVAGSAFHVFTPIQEEGDFNMIGNDPGEICWMELMVEEPAPVISFYSELFGWRFAAPMAMNGSEYFSLDVQGNTVGGIMSRPPSAPEMPPAWMNYFAVESVDEASAKAESLGGNIVMPKTEVPETGFFAVMADPTGAHAYLFEMTAK